MNGPPARVFLVSHRADATGAPKCLAVLARRLDRRRYQPVLIAPCDGPLISSLPPDVPAHVVPRGRFAHVGFSTVARFRLRDWPAFLWTQAAYVIALGRRVRQDADLVHVNTVEEPFAALAARFARRPVVWHVHETLPDTSAGRLMAKLVFRLATRVVAVSVHTARTLTRLAGRPETACRIVYNGVDGSVMGPDSRRVEIRRQLECAPDTFVLLLLGSVAPRKGQHVFVDSLERLSATTPNLVALVAGHLGDSDYANRLRARAEEAALQGTLRLLGHRSDVPELLAAADVVVVPSLVDPFPWVVLEAMAAGKPVVASDVCGIGEMVQHGETGLLVPPEDPATLAGALARMAEDPDLGRRLGAAGVERARRLFSVEQFVSGFEGIYREVLESRTQAG